MLIEVSTCISNTRDCKMFLWGGEGTVQDCCHRLIPALPGCSKYAHHVCNNCGAPVIYLYVNSLHAEVQQPPCLCATARSTRLLAALWPPLLLAAVCPHDGRLRSWSVWQACLHGQAPKLGPGSGRGPQQQSVISNKGTSASSNCGAVKPIAVLDRASLCSAPYAPAAWAPCEHGYTEHWPNAAAAVAPVEVCADRISPRFAVSRVSAGCLLDLWVCTAERCCVCVLD